jgi:hypothetical protein
MTTSTIPVAVFRLGRLMATPNALRSLSQDDIQTAIRRHQAGDWGDVSHEDWEANDRALTQGSRIFSVYHAVNGTKFWVITEADRSVTTILLPADY